MKCAARLAGGQGCMMMMTSEVLGRTHARVLNAWPIDFAAKWLRGEKKMRRKT